jgi:mannose-1-phosphate guanylyltransferase
MQIIINAGGTGTRLWPYSTNKNPKQFVPLVDETSFLRKTYDRLVSNFSPTQIWVNTNINFKQLAIDSLPSEFDPSHILTEPEKRDNFAAIIAHAAVVAHHVGNQEPLLFVHADHLILEKDWQKFNQALEIDANNLQNSTFEIITAGVRPKFANTQLGYIEILDSEIDSCCHQAVKVQKFKEKPDQTTAEEFLKAGNFLWNLGYFSFTFESLWKNLEKFAPDTLPIIQNIRDTGVILAADYSILPKIAFDYAIAEKTDSLGVIGIDIDWEDIGNWNVAAKYLPQLAEMPSYVELAGQGNQAKSHIANRKIAFVGVSNLMLVESEEGLLVIDPKYAGEVKKAAEYFEKID